MSFKICRFRLVAIYTHIIPFDKQVSCIPTYKEFHFYLHLKSSGETCVYGAKCKAIACDIKTRVDK